MTQKSRAAILTEIGSLLADNTSQDITPSDVRSVVQDINDSFMLNTSLTRAALQALMSGVTVEVNSMYTVTNAVGATKVIVVFGKTTSTISTLALNLTDNTFGNYNISADTFVSNVVTYRLSFSYTAGNAPVVTYEVSDIGTPTISGTDGAFTLTFAANTFTSKKVFMIVNGSADDFTSPAAAYANSDYSSEVYINVANDGGILVADGFLTIIIELFD